MAGHLKKGLLDSDPTGNACPHTVRTTVQYTLWRKFSCGWLWFFNYYQIIIISFTFSHGMLNSHFRTYFAMCLPLCFNFLFGCFPSTFSTGALEDTAGAPASCILAPDWDFSSFDVPTGKILNFQNTRRHLQGAGTRLERKDTKI